MSNLDKNIKRFCKYVEWSTTGCIIWNSTTNSRNYGRFGIKKQERWKQVAAHRFSYEMCVGEIPSQLQIDHICRNRRCVNPAHLRLVTLKENILIGIGISAMNARKTHCKRGHEFTTSNTRVYKGTRCCRECNRTRRNRGFQELIGHMKETLGHRNGRH